MKTIKEIIRFFIFTIGNSLSFWLQLLLTFLLTELLHLFYIFSYTISLVLATIGLFFYNKYITFKKKDKHLILSLIKFTFLTLAIYIPNIILVYFITYLLNKFITFKENYLIAIIIVSIPYAFIYYLLSKKWIFKPSS